MEETVAIYNKIFNGELTGAKETLAKGASCLLALWYVVSGEVRRAEEIINNMPTTALNEMEQQIYLETKTLVKYARGLISEAEALAQQIVMKYPGAAFATYLLAQIAWKNRNFDLAFEHYRQLVNRYPQNEGLLFEIARTCIAMKNPRCALEYLDHARPSVRKKMYMSLLSVSGPMSRILMSFAIVILALISGFRFWLISTLVGAILIFALVVGFRMRDWFLLARLVGVAVFVLLAWMIVFVIFHLEFGI